MNIYKLSQDENTGYDTYDTVVVVAETEVDACLILPSGCEWSDGRCSPWATSPSNVEVEFIGVASSDLETGQIICESFNAG